jgi:hypothetical protein
MLHVHAYASMIDAALKPVALSADAVQHAVNSCASSMEALSGITVLSRPALAMQHLCVRERLLARISFFHSQCTHMQARVVPSHPVQSSTHGHIGQPLANMHNCRPAEAGLEMICSRCLIWVHERRLWLNSSLHARTHTHSITRTHARTHPLQCPKTPEIDALANGPNTLLLRRFYAGAGASARNSLPTSATLCLTCILSPNQRCLAQRAPHDTLTVDSRLQVSARQPEPAYCPVETTRGLASHLHFRATTWTLRGLARWGVGLPGTSSPSRMPSREQTRSEQPTTRVCCAQASDVNVSTSAFICYVHIRDKDSKGTSTPFVISAHLCPHCAS